jgi:DNA-binding MarR family transcriptional regulator
LEEVLTAREARAGLTRRRDDPDRPVVRVQLTSKGQNAARVIAAGLLDVGAMVCHVLGVDLAAEVRDRQNRRVQLNPGTVMEALFTGAGA